MKKNTLYTKLFNVYFRFIAILIFILLLIVFLVTDKLITKYNSTIAMSNLQKTSDNISYRLQQDINLAYSLASNEIVISNLLKFKTATPSNKLDYDLTIQDFFNNYWTSHPEIVDISIFLQERPQNTPNRYSSIQYLSYNETTKDWNDYFQADSSVFIPEYSWGKDSYTTLAKDVQNATIIVPIIHREKTIGHIGMFIDKNALFSPYLKNISHYDISKISIYNNNSSNIIFGDTVLLPDNSELLNRILSTPHKFQGRKKLERNYCLLATQPSSHGLRLVQFFPYNEITVYRIPILIMTLIILILFWYATLLYTKKNALLISKPLADLSDAMTTHSHVTFENIVMIDELANVYNTYNYILDENKRISEQHTKAEIHALLAQISPHFLYNTLSVIAWKAANANQTEICTIVSKLAKLFHSSYNFHSDFINLKSEINHIDLYLQLQKECFKNNFDYDISVTNELLDLYVPRFILQPLIENSIIHGFSQIGHDGHIHISCSADEFLEIIISDNGCGISKNIIDTLNNNEYRTQKYGIYNINKRIKMLCGSEYGISFTSNGHSNTTASITLPIKKDIPTQL